MKTVVTLTLEVQDGYTFEELRHKLSELEGRSIPPTTLKDWITHVCKLDLKSTYSESDFWWLFEWIRFKKQFPERSTVKVKRFHEHMRKKCQNPN